MLNLKQWVIAGGLSLCVVGCDNINNQDMGAVTGGVLGGVLGNQVGHGRGRTAAIIGGTVIGALVGGSIGKSMDDVDRMKLKNALETAPSNQPVSWQNPDTGYAYTVQPQAAVIASNGQPCREYTTTALIGGKKQEVYGKACRDASGSWKVVQ